MCGLLIESLTYRQYFQHFFGNGATSERWALPFFRKLCQPLRQYAGWGTQIDHRAMLTHKTPVLFGQDRPAAGGNYG
ncbi:hypothetical protein D3C75_1230520 [compost metagenome]